MNNTVLLLTHYFHSDFGTNEVTNQLYSSCIRCRENTARKLELITREDREIANKEFLIKKEETEAIRNKKLNTEFACLQTRPRSFADTAPT